MKTRWYKEWFSGTIGNGGNITEYYQPDKSISFCGFSRIDSFPANPEARAGWDNMNVGDSFETISGSIIERIQ